MKNNFSEWFNIYYSQNKEDLILQALLPNVKKGFYVDVGAHDPVYFSVTKLFYDKGWSGVNIEPQEYYYNKLKKSRPLDINLKCAIDRTEGTTILREYKDASGLSTLSPAMQNSYIKNEEYKTVTSRFADKTVDTIPLKKILATYAKGRVVHFLKIDVEGYELQVIESNDWIKFRPVILCIEANHEESDWHRKLKEAHYEIIFNDGLNQYFVAREHFKEIRATFDYAEKVLKKIPLSFTPFDIMSKEIQRVHKEYQKLQKFTQSQDRLIKKLHADLQYYSPAHRVKSLLNKRRQKK